MVEISADSNAQLLARLKKEIYAAILPETEPIEAYQVNKFYREEWRNQNIPYEKFGYESLDQFLRSLTDIIDWWQPKLGTYTYKAKVTQATAHVHLMIAAQRKHPKPSKRQSHRSINSNGDRYASGFSMSLNGRMPPSLSTNRPRMSVPPRFRKQFGSVESEPIMPASTFDSTKNSSSFSNDFSRSFNNRINVPVGQTGTWFDRSVRTTVTKLSTFPEQITPERETLVQTSTASEMTMPDRRSIATAVAGNVPSTRVFPKCIPSISSGFSQSYHHDGRTNTALETSGIGCSKKSVASVKQTVVINDTPDIVVPVDLTKTSHIEPQSIAATPKSTTSLRPPSIAKLQEQLTKTLINIYPNTLAISQLGDQYEKEYGIRFDPMDVYCKTWEGLVVGPFRDRFKRNADNSIQLSDRYAATIDIQKSQHILELKKVN